MWPAWRRGELERPAGGVETPGQDRGRSWARAAGRKSGAERKGVFGRLERLGGRGGGNLELVRGGFDSEGSGGFFSLPDQVRDAVPGGRQILVLHVSPDNPDRAHHHVLCRS